MNERKVRKIYRFVLLVLLLVSLWKLRFPSSLTNLKGMLIGVIGAYLIFSGEFVYSMRKEKQLKIGKVKHWLKAHVFIGVVSLFLILIHTKLRFISFGGLALFLILIISLSGIFGYYLFKLIPKSKGQKELHLKRLFKHWRVLHVPLTIILFVMVIIHIFSIFYYGKLV